MHAHLLQFISLLNLYTLQSEQMVFDILHRYAETAKLGFDSKMLHILMVVVRADRYFSTNIVPRQLDKHRLASFQDPWVSPQLHSSCLQTMFLHII